MILFFVTFLFHNHSYAINCDSSYSDETNSHYTYPDFISLIDQPGIEFSRECQETDGSTFVIIQTEGVSSKFNFKKSTSCYGLITGNHEDRRNPQAVILNKGFCPSSIEPSPNEVCKVKNERTFWTVFIGDQIVYANKNLKTVKTFSKLLLKNEFCHRTKIETVKTIRTYQDF